MAEFKIAAIIKMSENSMSLSWDWIRSEVRVRLEWECFWVNLREENKVSEFHNAEAKSKMAEIQMAAIIKLGENEWVWVRLN